MTKQPTAYLFALRTPAIIATPERYRWVVMGLYWTANMAATMATFSLLVMLPAVKEEMALSPGQLGWLTSASWLSVAVLSMPFAAFFSRFGPRKLLSATMAAGALLAVLQGWAPTFEILLLARLGLSAVMVARMPAMTILIQQWFPTGGVARVTGIGVGLNNIGQAAAVGLAPIMLEALGSWRSIYYVYAAMMVALLLLWLLGGRERVTAEYRARAAAQVETPLKVMLRHPSLWVVAACQIGSAAAYSGFLSFWPTFAVEVKNVSLTLAGSLMTLWPIGSIIGSFSAGYLARLLHQRKPIIWVSGFGLVVCYLALITTELVPLMGMLLLFIGFFALVVVPLINSIPYYYQGILPREVAVSVAMIQTVTVSGAAAGPLIIGLIQSLGGSLHDSLMVVAVCASTLGVLGLMLPNVDRQPSRTV